jgi:flagellin
VNENINDALNRLGADARYVDAQIGYNRDKLDAIEGGLGALIDADIAKEAARLQALQIRQQLGTQTLSITNQAPQALISLFGR